MKKIKLLTSLAGLSALSMGLVPAIASCSCSSTGLQVEMVSKKKDREFNQKTNGSIYTFKLNNITTNTNLKVKLVNLLVDGAETKTVAGLLKTTYDSAGNIRVLLNINVLASQWPNASNFTFDLQFTDKSTGNTTTLTGFSLTYNALLTAPSFETVDWSEIFTKLDEYYETGSLEDFVKSFGDEDGFAFTDIEQYVGLQRTIKINNQNHIIRIIGVNHDALTSKIGEIDKALFTFQLETLLSDTSGNYLLTQFDNKASSSGGGNTNYCDSILRASLTGGGSGTLHWYKPDGSDSDITVSALKMIENQDQKLFSEIKSVTKIALVNETLKTGAQNYVKTPYDDKLFPLTYCELGYVDEAITISCGKTYKYWELNEKKSSDEEKRSTRIRRDSNGTGFNWWLNAPLCVAGLDWAFYVAYSDSYPTDSGKASAHYSIDKFATAFAFCI